MQDTHEFMYYFLDLKNYQRELQKSLIDLVSTGQLVWTERKFVFHDKKTHMVFHMARVVAKVSIHSSESQGFSAESFVKHLGSTTTEVPVKPDKASERIAELPEIWDAMAIVWRHWNDRFGPFPVWTDTKSVQMALLQPSEFSINSCR